jgi:hypothetical protein
VFSEDDAKGADHHEDDVNDEEHVRYPIPDYTPC